MRTLLLDCFVYPSKCKMSSTIRPLFSTFAVLYGVEILLATIRNRHWCIKKEQLWRCMCESICCDSKSVTVNEELTALTTVDHSNDT